MHRFNLLNESSFLIKYLHFEALIATKVQVFTKNKIMMKGIFGALECII